MKYNIINRKYPSDVILKFRANFDNYLINESILDSMKFAWEKVKNKFKSVVNRLIGNEMDSIQSLEDEVIVTIPSGINNEPQELVSQEYSLDEGALESIRGNYNEVLTVKYVIEKNELPITLHLTENAGGHDEIVVTLDVNGKKQIPIIESKVKKWDDDLRRAAGKQYDSIFYAISLASNDMANYIVSSVGNNDGNILEIFLDNDAFKAGAEFKADIRIRVKKKLGDSIIKSYSLKMYSAPNINLHNSSKVSIISNLISASDGKEFKLELKSDSTYNAFMSKLKPIDAQMRLLKKTNKLNSPVVEKIRSERQKFRAPLNIYLAEKIYEKLNEFANEADGNKEILTQNILKLIGFKDKDTEMLLSLVGKSQLKQQKSIIVDAHPELDFSDLNIVYNKGVAIKIFGNSRLKNPMITFTIKEGKNVASTVSFQELINKSK